MLGPITTVQGHATNQTEQYPAEDNVTASFVFESGVTGVGLWHFSSTDFYDQTLIIGSEGHIAFSSFDTEPLLLVNVDGEQFIEIDNPPHVHQPLIQTIVDELNGTDKCPSTGISGARTTWVTDQLLQTYQAAKK
jgi:predicted dehydrogenase